jgi:hypothetical protein
MGGPTSQPDPKSFGVISIGEADELNFRPRGTAKVIKVPRVKYTWHPPESLRGQLPPGFQLSLQCVTGPDGVRRFYPWNSFEIFLALASAGGLAILSQRQNLSGGQRHSYKAMRLLFLRVRRMAEFLGRKFEYVNDLSVVSSGRASPEEKDILPHDLGLDNLGRGSRWSIKELKEHGRAAARAFGIPKPTIQEEIRHGFLAAARLNPLPLEDDKVPLLIRSALFNYHSADEPNPKSVKMFKTRLLSAMQSHLDDDGAAFDKWFLGPNNSLLRQLCSLKGSPGGELEKAEGRKALLHLGWRAYGYASNCIHAQMRTFQNALPDALSDRERLLFEHMHQLQPYLGNLPLVLLIPRFGFLEPTLWGLWEHLPDLGLTSTLYRMLDYYSTMVIRRREADRRIKRGRPRTFVEESHEPTVKSDAFQEIAAEIRESREIDCGCPSREWIAEIMGRPGKRIRILHQCVACKFQKETVLTKDEFIGIGRAIIE